MPEKFLWFFLFKKILKSFIFQKRFETIYWPFLLSSSLHIQMNFRFLQMKRDIIIFLIFFFLNRPVIVCFKQSVHFPYWYTEQASIHQMFMVLKITYEKTHCFGWKAWNFPGTKYFICCFIFMPSACSPNIILWLGHIKWPLFSLAGHFLLALLRALVISVQAIVLYLSTLGIHN